MSDQDQAQAGKEAAADKATTGAFLPESLFKLAIKEVKDHPLLVVLLVLAFASSCVALWAIKFSGEPVVAIVAIGCSAFLVLGSLGAHIHQSGLKGQLAKAKRDAEASKALIEHCECTMAKPEGATERQVRKLKRHLSVLRTAAFREIQANYPDLEEKNVRANAFFPKRIPNGLHVPTELAMHPESVVGEFSQKELDLTFLPGQGTVGLAFRDRKTRTALATHAEVPEGEEWKRPAYVEWDRPLSRTQKEALHKDLRWVLSIPIRDPQSQVPLAVVCIDGLKTPLDNDKKLTKISRDQASRIGQVLSCISGFPQIKCGFMLTELLAKGGGE